MLLVVGLGNPGKGYANHRHNIGFMAADEIVRRHSFGPWRNKFQAETSDGHFGDDKAIILKPQTYMNLSGQAVFEAAKFYKIPLENIIVFHDELDLAPGKLKLKQGGGHAGHNGLRSIEQHMGKGFKRVRLGIGHPGARELVHGHVLGDFPKADKEGWLDKLLDAIAAHTPLLAAGKDTDFQSKVAMALKPPQQKKKAPSTKEKTAAEEPSSGSDTAAKKDTALGEALRAALSKSVPSSDQSKG